MIKAIITGAAGRMGSTIIRLINSDNNLEVIGAVEREGFSPVDAGIPANIGEIGVTIVDNIEKLKNLNADVIIDFTMPEATMKTLKFAVENSVSMVIGTTGLTEKDKAQIAEASKKIPIVQSPNMSVGVNTLFKLAEITAKILNNDYDIEIFEAHHRFKKDAPSGTAVKLGEIVAEAVGRKYPDDAVFERNGIIGERTNKEIGMQVIRAGDIVGEHTVMFGGIGERIELTHRAHNRENFARGALKAAKWIYKRDAGYYDMQDVLEIRNLFQKGE
jgi:4-hydroxy-tetrahydrodipicolinate reductase